MHTLSIAITLQGRTAGAYSPNRRNQFLPVFTDTAPPGFDGSSIQKCVVATTVIFLTYGDTRATQSAYSAGHSRWIFRLMFYCLAKLEGHRSTVRSWPIFNQTFVCSVADYATNRDDTGYSGFCLKYITNGNLSRTLLIAAGCAYSIKWPKHTGHRTSEQQLTYCHLILVSEEKTLLRTVAINLRCNYSFRIKILLISVSVFPPDWSLCV